MLLFLTTTELDLWKKSIRQQIPSNSWLGKNNERVTQIQSKKGRNKGCVTSSLIYNRVLRRAVILEDNEPVMDEKKKGRSIRK